MGVREEKLGLFLVSFPLSKQGLRDKGINETKGVSGRQRRLRCKLVQPWQGTILSTPKSFICKCNCVLPPVRKRNVKAAMGDRPLITNSLVIWEFTVQGPLQEAGMTSAVAVELLVTLYTRVPEPDKQLYVCL